MFSLPLKYPLSTEIIATKYIEGDNATNVNSASGIPLNLAIVPAPKNKNPAPIKPIIANVNKAILNILCAPLWLPTEIFSETNLETAFGTPIDEIVNSNA